MYLLFIDFINMSITDRRFIEVEKYVLLYKFQYFLVVRMLPFFYVFSVLPKEVMVKNNWLGKINLYI